MIALPALYRQDPGTLAFWRSWMCDAPCCLQRSSSALSGLTTFRLPCILIGRQRPEPPAGKLRLSIVMPATAADSNRQPLNRATDVGPCVLQQMP